MEFVTLFKEKWIHPPRERKESFRGQVVLVTGANSGIGLEAAKKMAALQADKLIVTTRDMAKGQATVDTISKWLQTNSLPQVTKISYLLLDMTSSKDVREFVRRLQAVTDRLDSAVLNAGISMPQHELTSDGFEKTLAVNAINTVYLAHLLSPIMVNTAKSNHKQTHLTVVSSRAASKASAIPSEEICKFSRPLQELSKAENFPSGSVGGLIRYAQAKLMLEFAFRHLSRSSDLYNESKKAYVILNSVDPGVTYSNLSRSWSFWLMRAVKVIWQALFAKKPERSANSYLTALTRGEESIGQMWVADKVEAEWDCFRGPKGKVLGTNVWNELQTLMREWDGKAE